MHAGGALKNVSKDLKGFDIDDNKLSSANISGGASTVYLNSRFIKAKSFMIVGPFH